MRSHLPNNYKAKEEAQRQLYENLVRFKIAQKKLEMTSRLVGIKKNEDLFKKNDQLIILSLSLDIPKPTSKNEKYRN